MAILNLYDATTARLRAAGDYVWPLALRLIMFWEFWESGITKHRGENWFQHIPTNDWVKGFPWPVSQLPPDLSWFLATWGELVLAFMVLFGLFTRFAAVSLIVFTAIATSAVHWPGEWSGLGELWKGYAITAKGLGNFKLPLLFVIMLLPLVFHGGGRVSLDRVLLRLTRRSGRADETAPGWQAAGLALLVLALATIWVEETWGVTLIIAAALAFAAPLVRKG